MKSFPGFLALLLIVGAGLLGCSGDDKDRATAGSGMPSSSNTSEGAGGVASADQSVQVNPSSSGGSTLPASMPYSQGKSGAVSQSVNPAPFLTASEAKPETQKATGSTGLVSRADGTMYGPNDQPAAGIGPGMEGATQGGASRASNGGAGKASGGGLAPVKPPSNPTGGK